jgi:dihydroorotase
MTTNQVRHAWEDKRIVGVKLYPRGATTESASGVVLSRIEEVYPIFHLMEDRGIPLLIHGETVPPDEDRMSKDERLASQFGREAAFVTEYLIPLARKFPKLKIVLEHISSRTGIEFVTGTEPEAQNVYGTLTAHHLTYTWDDVYHRASNTLNPHRFCYPVIKTADDRAALREHMESPKVGLGTDSAPHWADLKEEDDLNNRIPRGGCFTAPDALALYAEAFWQAGKPAALNDFAAVNLLRQVYGIDPSEQTLTLVPDMHKGTESVRAPLIEPDREVCTPYEPNDLVHWRIQQ